MTEEIARHCMMCNDVYYKGQRMTQKEYHRKYTNKDYTTGICGEDKCINTYLQDYVKDESLATLIKEDIKSRGW